MPECELPALEPIVPPVLVIPPWPLIPLELPTEPLGVLPMLPPFEPRVVPGGLTAGEVVPLESIVGVVGPDPLLPGCMD